MQTLQIGPFTAHLDPPTSLASAWEVLSLHTTSPQRALGAALGVCWRKGPGAPRTTLAAHRYDVGAYGNAVLDELLAKGIPYGELLAAGGAAVRLLIDLLPTESEVQAEADFLPPAGAGSTSSPPTSA